MIKTLVAYTKEIDDPEFAIGDIQEQLNFDELLKNTVGIIYCVPDFIDTKVLKAITEILPFPTIGATTVAAAVNNSDSPLILAILVMTSDDVDFKLATTGDLTGNEDDIVNSLKEATQGMEGLPKLCLTFFPLQSVASGDWLVNTYSKYLPEVPLFGTMCVSMEDNFKRSLIVIDGEFYKERSGVILVYGPIEPKFFIGTISEDKYLKSKGIITKVSNKGATINTINDTPATQYLHEMGLSCDEAGQLIMPELFPLVIDFNDGTNPILRAMLSGQKGGDLVLAGEVAEGAILSVSSIDPTDVRLATEKTLKAVAKSGACDCILLHSCLARYYVAMELDPDLELNVIRQFIDEDTHFIISYSGGEICPVPGKNNVTKNRMHNYTFIACTF
ncbi:MAG: FIST C-terminal domain-containing protein [Deltaproteobacteria bacterium]|jgi:hypothetical protein|nr:FIST C-terminal domain-containing protein [Deltaproteobacteria bacterium]